MRKIPLLCGCSCPTTRASEFGRVKEFHRQYYRSGKRFQNVCKPRTVPTRYLHLIVRRPSLRCHPRISQQACVFYILVICLGRRTSCNEEETSPSLHCQELILICTSIEPCIKYPHAKAAELAVPNVSSSPNKAPSHPYRPKNATHHYKPFPPLLSFWNALSFSFSDFQYKPLCSHFKSISSFEIASS